MMSLGQRAVMVHDLYLMIAQVFCFRTTFLADPPNDFEYVIPLEVLCSLPGKSVQRACDRPGTDSRCCSSVVCRRLCIIILFLRIA